MLRLSGYLGRCKKPESMGLHPWSKQSEEGRRESWGGERERGGAVAAAGRSARPVLLSDHNKTPLHYTGLGGRASERELSHETIERKRRLTRYDTKFVTATRSPPM